MLLLCGIFSDSRILLFNSTYFRSMKFILEMPVRHVFFRSVVYSLISFLLISCGSESPPVEEVVPRVKYFEGGEQTSGQLRRISGKLVSDDTSRLSFNVAGTVEEVLVVQGQAVQQGELLARLDPEPIPEIPIAPSEDPISAPSKWPSGNSVRSSGSLPS